MKMSKDIFLWEDGALEKRCYLVNWNFVCLFGKERQKDGGLGIFNLSILNKALLGKQNWRFTTKKESSWKQIITRKFEEEDMEWCL